MSYKIYKIYCETTNNVYIGKTRNSIKKRLIQHKSDYRKQRRYCSSWKIFKNNNYYYCIVEDNISKENINIKERFYVDNTPNCINDRTPYITREERKEKQIKYKKNYKPTKESIIKRRQNNKIYREKDKNLWKEYDRLRYQYIISWGGVKNWNNNLLQISLDIFD